MVLLLVRCGAVLLLVRWGWGAVRCRYTGVCINLEQIGLRNVMCGRDLVVVCNAWAASNLYIVFFGAVIYSMGCYLLFGVSNLASVYAATLNSHGRLRPGSRRPKSAKSARAGGSEPGVWPMPDPPPAAGPRAPHRNARGRRAVNIESDSRPAAVAALVVAGAATAAREPPPDADVVESQESATSIAPFRQVPLNGSGVCQDVHVTNAAATDFAYSRRSVVTKL